MMLLSYNSTGTGSGKSSCWWFQPRCDSRRTRSRGRPPGLDRGRQRRQLGDGATGKRVEAGADPVVRPGVGGQVDQQLAQQLLAGPGAEDLPGRVVGVEQPAQPDPLLGGQGAAVADQSCRQAHASLVVEHDPSAEGPEERPSVDASAFGRPSAVSGK